MWGWKNDDVSARLNFILDFFIVATYASQFNFIMIRKSHLYIFCASNANF